MLTEIFVVELEAFLLLTSDYSFYMLYLYLVKLLYDDPIGKPTAVVLLSIVMHFTQKLRNYAVVLCLFHCIRIVWMLLE